MRYTPQNTDLKAILYVATLGLAIAWITTVLMHNDPSKQVHLPAVCRHLFPLRENHYEEDLSLE